MALMLKHLHWKVPAINSLRNKQKKSQPHLCLTELTGFSLSIGAQWGGLSLDLREGRGPCGQKRTYVKGAGCNAQTPVGQLVGGRQEKEWEKVPPSGWLKTGPPLSLSLPKNRVQFSLIYHAPCPEYQVCYLQMISCREGPPTINSGRDRGPEGL